MISMEVDSRGLIADLRKYGEEGEKAINKAVEATSNDIKADAMSRLRGMFGSNDHSTPYMKGKRLMRHGGAGLLGSIYNKRVQSMERIVGTAKRYAAYIEFGIGDFVFTNMNFSKEAKEVAALFKGSKKVKGFKGDSFLNWSAVNQEKKHIERLENELNKLNK